MRDAFDKISESQILEAIQRGACEAISRMIYQYTDRPFAELCDAVRSGVDDAMPLGSEIKEAISEGIVKAMPYPSEIVGAVYEARKDE